MMKEKFPMHNTSSSPGRLKAERDFEYLKRKNLEFTKEITELRKCKTKLQADVDYLLREKFEEECKHNHLQHIMLSVDKRSKVCLNKIVECSTELTQIMQLISRAKELNRSSSITPSELKDSTTPPQLKDTSFKQVVTPHAVNGHVIHSPTIRIARYNVETVENACQNAVEDQNHQEENLESNGEMSQGNDPQSSDEDVDPGNTTFKSRGGVYLKLDIGLLTSSQLEEEEEEDADHEKNDDVDRTQETLVEEPDTHLPTITEEENESLDQLGPEEESQQPVFSGRFQEVKIYLNQVADERSRNQNWRMSNSSTTDASEAEKANSSITAEASVSFDETLRFKEDMSFTRNSLSMRKFSSPKRKSFSPKRKSFSPKRKSFSPKRKSFSERKSIGSPVPVKVYRRILNNEGYSSSSSASSILTTPSESTLKYRRSQERISNRTETSRKSIGSPISATIERRSGNVEGSESTSKYRRSQERISDWTGRSETSLSSVDTGVPTVMAVSSVDSFTVQNSAHSTPLIQQIQSTECPGSVTPKRSKVNVRKVRKKTSNLIPVVQLKKLKLSETELAKWGVNLMKNSETFKGEEMKTLIESQIERGKPNKTKKRTKSNSSDSISPSRVRVTQVKRESSPTLSDESNVGRSPKRRRQKAKPIVLKERSSSRESSPTLSDERTVWRSPKRPTRRAKPTSLKEPSLTRKMRRSR